MTLLKVTLLGLSSAGLIILGACSNGNQTANSDSSPGASSETATQSQAPQTGQGKQVVESGPYHLEFASEPGSDGIHLDFYLQKGDTHEAISNADVTAQVQTPDGQEKSLDMTYDSAGKHYTVLLPEKAPGEYQVAVLSDINGEKVNGRFQFNQ